MCIVRHSLAAFLSLLMLGVKAATEQVCKSPGVPPAQPIVPPIVHTSSYRLNSVDHFIDLMNSDGFTYIRFGSPTVHEAELAVSRFECNGLHDTECYTVAFGSGMAAISSALLTFLKPGDHVVAGIPVYGGTFEFMNSILADNLKIEVTYVNGTRAEDFAKHIKPNTKVLYAETPANPTLNITDLKVLADIARHSGLNLTTMVDGTFASPYLLQSLKYGISVAIHSATKYLGGHDDLCAGVVTSTSKNLDVAFRTTRTMYGSILSPHDASLLLRGTRTLEVRVRQQCATALRLAQFLQANVTAIDKVMYPGLKSHPQHRIAKEQMNGLYGGMLAIEYIGDKNETKDAVNRLKVFKLGVSLGGTDSLVEHPATMTHGDLFMNDEQRREMGVTPGLVRLSIGLEPFEVLKDDLVQAFRFP